MHTFGLTGGIACGKSTVARMFEELGARVLDADQIARDVVRRGEPAYGEIVREFGEEVLLPDGTIDRAALGRIVFSDAARRSRLNALTHPRIALESAKRLQSLKAGGASIVLYEAALLVETGGYKMHEGLIVVASRPEVHLSRLQARDGCSEDEARKKIASQLPLEKKTAVADYVIDNSGSLEETQAQVRKVWESLLSKCGRSAGGPRS